MVLSPQQSSLVIIIIQIILTIIMFKILIIIILKILVIITQIIIIITVQTSFKILMVTSGRPPTHYSINEIARVAILVVVSPHGMRILKGTKEFVFSFLQSKQANLQGWFQLHSTRCIMHNHLGHVLVHLSIQYYLILPKYLLAIIYVTRVSLTSKAYTFSSPALNLYNS